MKRIKLTVDLANETSHDLVITNASLVAWDRTRANFKWPDSQDAPMLWMTFIAWHHMRAAGLIACEFKDFEESQCLSVGDTHEPLTEDEEARMAELHAMSTRSLREEIELGTLIERAAESEEAVDPFLPAPEVVNSSSLQ